MIGHLYTTTGGLSRERTLQYIEWYKRDRGIVDLDNEQQLEEIAMRFEYVPSVSASWVWSGAEWHLVSDDGRRVPNLKVVLCPLPNFYFWPYKDRYPTSCEITAVLVYHVESSITTDDVSELWEAIKHLPFCDIPPTPGGIELPERAEILLAYMGADKLWNRPHATWEALLREVGIGKDWGLVK